MIREFTDEEMQEHIYGEKPKIKIIHLSREEMLVAIDTDKKVRPSGSNSLINKWSSTDFCFNKDTLWDIVE